MSRVKLSSSMARAGAWSVGGKLVSKVVDLATLVILSGILEPADFGLVAQAMAVVLVVEGVTSVSLGGPILRIRNPDQAAYDTAFTLTILRATFIAVVVLLSAFPVSEFFKEPRLVPLLCVLIFAPAFRGTMSPKMIEFMRQYDMRPEAMMDIASKLLSLAIVTTVALMTRSYWAIAIGTVTTGVTVNILSYVYAPYRPKLSLERWKDFSDIVTWNSASKLLDALSWQLDRFLLGRFLDNTTFGLYAVSANLNDIPQQSITLPLARPMATAFAEVDTDDARRTLWLRFSNAITYVVGPVLIILAVLADQVVFAILGPGWEEAGPYLSGLAIATLPFLPTLPLNALMISIFKTHLITLRMAIQFALSIPIMVVLVLWAGAMGAIVARGIVDFMILVFSASLVRGQIGLGIWVQAQALWRTVVGLAVLAGALYFVSDAFTGCCGDNRLLSAALVAGLSFLGATFYFVVTVAMWVMSGKPGSPESFLLGRLNAVCATVFRRLFQRE